MLAATGGSPQFDPCHSPQGPRNPACTAVKHITILQEHLPELADVSEDAVHVLRIGAVVPAGEPVSEADDRLQAVLPNRRECLLDFIELLLGEISLLECLQVDLDQQQGNPALAQSIQSANAVAHARRVETTLRVGESLGALPVANFPPCRRVIGLRPPWHEAEGDEDAEGQRLSAHGRHRFRSARDRLLYHRVRLL